MLQLRGGGTHGKLFRPSLVYKDQADRQSRDCVNEKVAGVGGGGGTCYNCGEAGHMVCPLLLPSNGIELMIVPRMYRTPRSRLLPRRMS
jgi:hypothetical protein